jgi:hypothetical protein
MVEMFVHIARVFALAHKLLSGVGEMVVVGFVLAQKSPSAQVPTWWWLLFHVLAEMARLVLAVLD